MPISLADYGANIKAALKRGSYACVYVASAEGGRPCRVGYAEDLCAAVKRLERASPLAITVEDVIWVPDRGIATAIAQSVAGSIAEHRKAGGWYDLPAESVAQAVHLDTFRLYPNATTVPHKQLIAQWAAQARPG
jgi:hypothetical protein